ncbi:MAG TPA: 2OG-Fe(II) oxygenase [Bryobacteraceae bacterium]|nr:2OG-Fe(II) oxygenase [Bryobacteraceae bacterium]
MVQLTQTAILQDPEDIPRLKQEFAETGCALLPNFLAPGILRRAMEWVQSARFEETQEKDEHRGVFGTTLLAPGTEPALFLLKFILNRNDLYRFSEQVTDCEKIANFHGRLHRTTPRAEQHIDWHQDLAEGRTLGICINLSSEPYTGGVLEIRNPEHRMTAAVGRGNPGDACFFRIDRGWQHRLTPVESGCRTVGVGWFRTAPQWSDYAFRAERVRQMAAEYGSVKR